MAKVEEIDMFSGNAPQKTLPKTLNDSRVKELEHIIETLDTLFELGEECVNPITGEVVSDNEYDALRKELFQLSPNSPAFLDVTLSTREAIGKKIVHNPPMTSISKCNGTEEEKQEILLKWFKDCLPKDVKPMKFGDDKRVILLDFFSMSMKLDGIAISLEYEKGVLKRAGLRSKTGKDGIDVTDKAIYIDGIPKTLPVDITCKIRGELLTPIDVFEKKNKEFRERKEKGEKVRVFTNARAYTAGSMNLKMDKEGAKEFKDRGIGFIAYNVVGLENPPYKGEVGRSRWIISTLKMPSVPTDHFSFATIEKWENKHRNLPFMTDGIVISVDNLEKQKELGTHGKSDTGNPKGKIAWKFKDEIKEVMVDQVVWQTGRIGNITPVLIFNGVQLEGTTVSRCTAHNVGIIKTNKIGRGSTVKIIKSGKIIPKLKEVVKARGKVNIPTACPSCGGDVKEVEGSNDALALVCKNSLCPAQNIKNLNHFLTRLGVKGIAESTIDKLVELGLVQKPGDFYKLYMIDLMDAGITERTAWLIIARIWMVHEPEQIKDGKELAKAIKQKINKRIPIPANIFFSAFGIKNAGREAGRILASKYDSWKDIKKATEKELQSMDGIGPIMAKEIVAFFENNESMIEDVEINFDIQFAKQSGGLDGKMFVLSGSLDGGKSKWKKAIEEAGGVVKSSVGKRISYLVAGEGSGSKSDKAKELGVSIISVEELQKML
jgi:DNA ligase (NAD+)